MVGLPLQPHLIIFHRGFQWQVTTPFCALCGCCPPRKDSNLGSMVGRGPKLHSTGSPLLDTCPVRSPEESSSDEDSTFWSWKVTCLLGWVGLGDWRHLPIGPLSRKLLMGPKHGPHLWGSLCAPSGIPWTTSSNGHGYGNASSWLILF